MVAASTVRSALSPRTRPQSNLAALGIVTSRHMQNSDR